MQPPFLCLIIFSCLIVSIELQYHHVGASELDALLQLKQGFGNPSQISSWNTSINPSPCIGWIGVACAANSSSVIQLRLPKFNFTGGTISSSIGDLPNLQLLDLSSTGLAGPIPSEINKLPSLQNLDLSNNALTGELPLLWSNLTKLVSLTLTHNKLNGSIPVGLVNAVSLIRIRLENNELEGSIPFAIFDNNLPRLRYFAVEFNNISGSIPVQIGRSMGLKSFYAANNHLAGLIPETIGNLPNLSHFEVNNNQLSGPLPGSIINLTPSLLTFNVSYNNLTGEIPAGFSAKFNDSSAFVGNPSLCGSPLSACSAQTTTSSPPPRQFPDRGDPPNRNVEYPSYPSYKRNSSRQTVEIIGGVMGGVLGAFLLLFIFIVISRKLKQKKDLKGSSAQGQNWFSPDIQANRRKGSYELFSRSFQYSYEEIVSNAGYFDTAHVVGKGRFATVYRSHLPDGTQVAVKVFRFANVASNFEKEIELLASIKHRNLLSIKGFYANPVEKAIFYEYMPRGTLYELLHGQADAHMQEAALPDWPERHRIALGVAQAMAFLHRGCGYRILHRDLKSTNILLDMNLNPKVSDHGLVHLVSGRPGGVGDIIETPGYTAPEVITSKKYTEKADVYSYGVVLLELITGKKAVSYVRERAMSLTSWVVRLHKERRGREVMDAVVLKTCPLPEYLDRCLDLAVLCVDADPNGRPSVAEIVSVVEGCCPSPSPLRSPEFRLDIPLLLPR